MFIIRENNLDRNKPASQRSAKVLSESWQDDLQKSKTGPADVGEVHFEH